mmetsp:Transcript_53781/g.130832  ORF Transcript_53781/g.130832 Transcript_53781/m.130832 type:complete len:207 (+) Transcript_53781:489-1109(+)
MCNGFTMRRAGFVATTEEQVDSSIDHIGINNREDDGFLADVSSSSSHDDDHDHGRDTAERCRHHGRRTHSSTTNDVTAATTTTAKAIKPHVNNEYEEEDDDDDYFVELKDNDGPVRDQKRSVELPPSYIINLPKNQDSRKRKRRTTRRSSRLDDPARPQNYCRRTELLLDDMSGLDFFYYVHNRGIKHPRASLLQSADTQQAMIID